MSSQTFSTFSEVGMIDARSQNGVITLPLSTDIPYRILTLKDIYGAATVSSITLTTQGADVFEDGTTSRLLNGAFETTTLYAGQAGFWYTTGGSRLATAAIGSLSTGLIQNPLRLGTLSTQTAIQFPGLRSNYTGTVIAGQTTGVGTQELLLYQASSISDQIRLQTTGNIVFEAGAGARSFPSTAALVTPTLYIAGTTSNVGIGTASPATTLDVAGTGRFQTLSTIAMNVSSINGIVPGAAFIGSTNFISATTVQALTISAQSINVSSVNGILPGAAFNGSTLALSTAIITTSTLKTNTITTSTALITLNGSAAATSFGSGVDTLTLQANAAYTGGVASMGFTTATGGYPLARIYAIDASASGAATSQLVFQTAPASSSSFTSNYTYTGATTNLTVPAGVTTLSVQMWGGGGGAYNFQTYGGAGAYLTGVITVTSGQVLTVLVGGGGGVSNAPVSFGGGGSASYAGAGGGRSAIQKNFSLQPTVITITGASAVSSNVTYTTSGTHGLLIGQPITISGLTASFYNGAYAVTSVPTSNTFTTVNSNASTSSSTGTGNIIAELVIAAGGGGGGKGVQNGGPGTYVGAGSNANNGGTGGPQYNAASPQVGGIPGGGVLQGGTGDGTGGGGGYYGGGYAGIGTGIGYPGGGGSSYYALLSGATGSNSPNGYTAPAQTVPGYQVGVAAGSLTSGGNGQIIIATVGNALAEAMRIATNGNVGIGTTAPTTLLDVGGTIRATTVSTFAVNVSTINGFTVDQPINSTMVGLGTAGYISSTQLTSTVTGLAFTGSTTRLSAGAIAVSTINIIYLSSAQGYISSFRTDSLTVGGPTGYVTVQDLTTGTVSTGQLVAGAGFISSLQINTLSFGPSGYVIVGDVIANSLSTKKLNTQALYTNNLYVGNTSTQSAILFPGIDGNFRGTAVAEQVTGVGTEELLLYKVSSTTDQIRLQTTGNIVFEAGASARSWPSTAALATPTLYIQGSSSNVGIGTATPANTLDVAGTGRFQILSSYALNVSSINGIIPGAAFNGSTLALSTGSITTNSLQAYSYVNMTGGTLSNLATEYFTTPKFTTTFTPTSITGLKVWFDASQTTTILSNVSGQVPTWSNLATGYANAIQATSSNQPYTGKYTVNNLNTMQFNSGQGLSFGSINWTSSNQCVLAVLYTPTNPYSSGGHNWIFGGGNDRTGTQSFVAYEYGGTGFEFGTSVSGGYSLNAYIAGATLVSQNTFAGNAWIVTIHKGSVTNGAYINGTSNATVANFGTGSFSDKMGGVSDGGGNTFYICEYIHYDADLSLSQKQTLEGYLAWKWGTQGTLNGTHPYYSTPPPPVGTVYLAAGSVGTDATSNLTIQATGNTKISLAANTQITGVLTVSTTAVSTISGSYASFSTLSTQALIVSSLNNSTITQLVGGPIQSTVIGLGTAGYISTQQLAATSNFFQNLLALNVSSGISTATLFTSNTSNYFLPALSNNLSSAASSLALYTTATSNYFQNLLTLNVSSAISTATLYTSNTSNYFQNLLAFNVSSAISTATLFTSNTSNFILSTNQSSISTAFVTANQGFISSLVVNSLAIGSNAGFINMGDLIATSLSTLQLNTGLLTASGTVSAPELIVSSINGLPLLTLANLTSTVSGTNSNISSMIDPTELTSTVTGLGTANFISSVGLTTILASTVIGLNTYVSSMIDPTELTSTVTGLGTANFISSVGLTTILASTVIGLNTTIAAMIDPIELASSITGLGTTGFISSIGLDARFASTTQGLGTVGYLSSSQLLSTVQGLGTAGYASTSYVLRQISSFSTAMGQLSATFTGSTIFLSAATIQASNISTFQITAQNITTQALSTNALIFGTGTGTLLMPDIAPNTVYTSTVTTSNLQVGWTSNQSPIQFYGFGTYSNTVIVEQSTGTTTQELFVFRGSNAADRIRFQTTGYMAIETGVSSRLYTAALSNATPAVMIDINSNVGIQLAAPAFPLDVGGTARAPILSTLHLQTSTIQGAIFTGDLYANANTYLQGTVSTSFLLGTYNTLTFRTAGTQRATFTQAGNLGIGLAAPQYPVDIAGITRVSTIYNSTSISYNFISAPLLMASTVNTVNIQTNNISTNQINASLIYGRWNDAQYYVLQTL